MTMVVTGRGAAVWHWGPDSHSSEHIDSKVPMRDEAKLTLKTQWASFQSIDEGFLTGGWVFLPQQVTPGKSYPAGMRVEPTPLNLPSKYTLPPTLRPKKAGLCTIVAYLGEGLTSLSAPPGGGVHSQQAQLK